MNRQQLTYLLLLFIVLSFNSCKKEETEDFSNSVTITGTFTAGGKEYTNPTFALGSASDHIGYFLYDSKLKAASRIKIEPWDIVRLGNNTILNYNFSIEGIVPSSNPKNFWGNLSIYLDDSEERDFFLSNQTATVIITKVDEVGGYIEGTYEGSFKDDSDVSYHLNGVFKVKHIMPPN